MRSIIPRDFSTTLASYSVVPIYRPIFQLKDRNWRSLHSAQAVRARERDDQKGRYGTGQGEAWQVGQRIGLQNEDREERCVLTNILFVGRQPAFFSYIDYVDITGIHA